jgi:secreted protein with Ig-like and vWFA domain
VDIARKLHITDDTSLTTIDAPAELALPAGRTDSEQEAAMLFVRSRQEMLDRLADFLAGDPERPARWIAYPKGAGSDVNRAVVWEVAGTFAWRPVSQISISDDWSGMRLRRTSAVRIRTQR